MIFDTHSHYNDKQYTQDREAVLASLEDAGVTQVVNVSAVSYTHLDVYKRQVRR